MNKINVLVFPAGEINSLELHDSLSSCVNIRLFGASSIERHGGYVFENYIQDLPLIDEPEFLSVLKQIIATNNIHIIFPTHDTVAEYLTANSDEIPAIIMGGDAFTAKICRDKKLTYDLFANESFVPKIYKNFDYFPVFIKPIRGQGSQGARLIQDVSDIGHFEPKQNVICEYLPGEEYTVDCLTDKAGRLLCVCPRSRSRTLGGISVAGKTENLTPEIQSIAEKINEKLSFLGLWWFQIKKDANGKWKLLEISLRCAGTMSLTRASGINLPLLSVYTAIGREIDVPLIRHHVRMESALIRRYQLDFDYKIIYLDFDDTVVIKERVNLKAIWFIYQCRNHGKKVILLTRHADDIHKSLVKYGIAENLFAEIINIPKGKNKSDFINQESAIFIDNSWHERNEVQKLRNIPVFDADGFDALMEWIS